MVVACRREQNGSDKTKTDRNGAVFFLHQSNGEVRPISLPPRSASGAESANPQLLHQVYTAFIQSLSTSIVHRKSLLDRGLSDGEIDRRSYRTLPRFGRARIAETLRERFGDELLSVPGFVIKQGDVGEYVTIAGAVGILIPVRNISDQIVALKIRRDASGGGPRYLYLSSKKNGGPGPGSPIHVPLGIRKPAPLVRVTEGELKADIATILSDVPTISIPGVASWRPALEVLKELESRTVRLAFDADANSNQTVARCLLQFADCLVAEGFSLEMERW